MGVPPACVHVRLQVASVCRLDTACEPPAGGHSGFKSLSDVITSLSLGYADNPRVHTDFFKGRKHEGTRKHEHSLTSRSPEDHIRVCQSCSRMKVQECKGETKNSTTIPEVNSAARIY